MIPPAHEKQLHPQEQKNLMTEAVEYQPDAIEIKQERLPWWARYSVLLSFLFFLLALIWACIGKVDVVVTAPGKLVTDNPNIVMQPPELAVIDSVNVRVGETVKKDQILFTFDPTINRAEAARLGAETATLKAQFDRLNAEFTHQEYSAAPDDRDAQWQLAIFKQRQRYYQEKMNYYDQGIKQTLASAKTKKDSLEKQTERLEVVRKIEEMYKNLQEQDAIALKDLYETSITRMQMEVEVSNLSNSLVELEHEEQSIIANRNSFVEEWRKTISEELVDTRRELYSTLKQFDKAKQICSYEYLRAPCDAVVHEIASFSKGAGVREAEPLITLVPLDKLEVEAELEPKDVGKVKPGSEVRIKLNPFPFQKHGTLDGFVRTISENTFQRNPEPGAATAAYYKLRIPYSGSLNFVGDDFRLIPGMEVQCEIKTGTRRIIEYLIYPLIKSLDESMREP